MGIYWKSRPSYAPQVFDIVEDKAYVKVPITTCSPCRRYGYPETDAIYFVWTNQSWNQVHEKEAPPQLKFNLLASEYGGDPAKDARGLITLAEKKRRDGTIYSGMEYTGRKGPYEPGACAKCRSVSGPASTADVFVESSDKKCNW